MMGIAWPDVLAGGCIIAGLVMMLVGHNAIRRDVALLKKAALRDAVPAPPAAPLPANDDDSAFPWFDNGEGDTGMYLRDWFAGQSVKDFLARGFSYGEAATMAYAVADALLEKRRAK